jgi:mannobiose 2-epimerase
VQTVPWTKSGSNYESNVLPSAEIFENALKHHLSAWFPRCIDAEFGGFLCDFSYKWQPSGPQLKLLEFQARTTRLSAQVAAHPGFESYRAFAAHGFRYLREVVWDDQYGGWFHMLDRHGRPLEAGTKYVHGTSYALGACAAYYELTSDPEALDLAKKAFSWLEAVAHDSTNGGYFSAHQRDGTRITSSEQSPTRPAVRDYMGTPFGLKDTNTNGDMLEALVYLDRVCPDVTVKERLKEMFYLVRDRIMVAPGIAHMYFQPDWTPVPDVAQYAETLRKANILASSAVALGLSGDPGTAQVVKSVVDNLLRFAWDGPNGGFFFAGSAFGPTYVGETWIFVKKKFWWAQAEGLEALLMLALLYPDDEMDYSRRFTSLWSYIRKNMIDWRRGGWYEVGRDRFELRRRPKATMWKDASHETHAMLECIRMLRAAHDGC